MPARLAEFTLGNMLEPSEATLGTTRKSNFVQSRELDDTRAHAHHSVGATVAGALSKLPTEVQEELIRSLDPVSQMCLGLTCRSLHKVFHQIHGAEGEGWNFRRRPFGLSMQASLCGKYVLSWWYDDWFLRDSTDIDWSRSLGELLYDEKWLWRDLRCCQTCLKYKPEKAFVAFAWETDMLLKHIEKIDTLERSNDFGCKRCRAKAIFVSLENRHEVLEDGDEREYRKSLGLLKRTAGSEVVDNSMLSKLITAEEMHALEHNYERWEDIYAYLDI